MRILRFGVEAFLAAHYGRRILAWLEGDVVQRMVFGCIVFGVALTGWTLSTFFRAGRRARSSAA